MNYHVSFVKFASGRIRRLRRPLENHGDEQAVLRHIRGVGGELDEVKWKNNRYIEFVN